MSRDVFVRLAIRGTPQVLLQNLDIILTYFDLYLLKREPGGAVRRHGEGESTITWGLRFSVYFLLPYHYE